MNRYIFAFLVLLLVIAAAALGTWIGIETSLFQAYAEICNKNEYYGNKECATYHIALVSLWHVGKFLNEWGIALTAAFTLIIAVVTTLLFLDGKKSSERQLRAYVSVDTEDVLDKDKIPIPGQIGIVMRNAGQTPAKEIFQWTMSDVREFPLEAELERPPADYLKVRSVLHPGVTRWSIVGFPQTDDAASKGINEGNLAIYVWGEVHYMDVFDVERCTEFRFFITKEGFISSKGVHHHRWAHYKTGNRAT